MKKRFILNHCWKFSAIDVFSTIKKQQTHKSIKIIFSKYIHEIITNNNR